MAVELDNAVYVPGGENAPGKFNREGNTVDKYDLASETWLRVAPMTTTRVWSTAVVAYGCIYVLGGIRGERSMERYDPHADSWTRLGHVLVHLHFELVRS